MRVKLEMEKWDTLWSGCFKIEQRRSVFLYDRGCDQDKLILKDKIKGCAVRTDRLWPIRLRLRGLVVQRLFEAGSVQERCLGWSSRSGENFPECDLSQQGLILSETAIPQFVVLDQR